MFTLSLTSPLFTGVDKAVVVLGGFGAGATTLLEEIGWTGFVVPRLRRRHSVLMTGLIVGVLWGLWHFLQQIFVSGTYAGGIPLLTFLMLSVLAAVTSLTAYRVLMVWVYDRTGSLLVTTMMHGMLTASTIFWFTPLATGALFLADVWLVAAAMWLLVGVVGVIEGWLRLGHTSPFRGPDGKVLLNSIAEAKYVRLGGIDQWVMIRGENVANPPLIVLHGGPGMSEMGFFRRCQRVPRATIHRRQLGSAGHRQIVRARHSEILDDAGSVRRRSRRARRHRAPTLREGPGRDPRPLLGFSPRRDLRRAISAKVSVYVGAAQIGDWPAAESSSYAYGLAEAERQHDEQALKKLRAIGPPPYPAESVFVERTVVSRLDGQMRLGIIWKTGRALFGRPESSILDLPNLVRGFGFTLDAMWAEVSKLNLLKVVPALKMPVVICVGRRDHWVPPETSVAYFDTLSAPSKNLVWFDDSGHEAFVDESEKFNATMVELVRPLASTAGAQTAPARLRVSA